MASVTLAEGAIWQMVIKMAFNTPYLPILNIA